MHFFLVRTRPKAPDTGFVAGAPIPITAGRKKLDAETRKKLDRFGYLDQRYEEAKPWLKERDELKKFILDLNPEHPADQSLRVSGNSYHVDLTPREFQRKIVSKAKAFAALKKALGKGLADALSYTLKLLEEHVPASELEKFVTKERTGPRDVTAVLIEPPKVA